MNRETYLTTNFMPTRDIDKALAAGYGRYRRVRILKQNGSWRDLEGIVRGIHGKWLIAEDKDGKQQLRRVPMKRVVEIKTRPWYLMTPKEFLEMEDNCD